MYKSLSLTLFFLSCISLPLSQAKAAPADLPQVVSRLSEEAAPLPPSWAADIANHPILFSVLAPLVYSLVLLVVVCLVSPPVDPPHPAVVLVAYLLAIVISLVASLWTTPWQVELGDSGGMKKLYTPPLLSRLLRAFRFSASSMWTGAVVCWVLAVEKGLGCVLPSSRVVGVSLILVGYPCLLAFVVWLVVWGGYSWYTQPRQATAGSGGAFLPWR